MATRHSKSKARLRRNSAPSNRKPTALTQAKLKAAIETERRHLQRVHSLLGCIFVAFDGGAPVCDLDYADAIEAARSLVGESVDRLDLVNLLRSRSEK